MKKNKKEIKHKKIVLIGVVVILFVFLMLFLVFHIIPEILKPLITIYENVCENETYSVYMPPHKNTSDVVDDLNLSKIEILNCFEEHDNKILPYKIEDCDLNLAEKKIIYEDKNNLYMKNGYFNFINNNPFWIEVKLYSIEQICTQKEVDEIEYRCDWLEDYSNRSINQSEMECVYKSGKYTKKDIQENPEWLDDNCECLEEICPKKYSPLFNEDGSWSCTLDKYNPYESYSIEKECSKYKCGNYEVEVQR